MSRTVTFSGSGWLRTWLAPTDLQQAIQNALHEARWGATVTIANTPSTNQRMLAVLNPLVTGVPTWHYGITIDVNITAETDINTIRRAMLTILSIWFSDVSLTVVRDTAHPLQGFINQYGIWIGLGFAGLVILKMLKPQAAQVIPYVRRRYRF